MSSKDASPESRRHFMRQSLKRLGRFGFSIAGEDFDRPATKPPKPKTPITVHQRPVEPPRPIEPPNRIWLNHNPEMAYSRLGRTNFMMSRIAMGCEAIGASNAEIVRKAVRRGVNFFVTAHDDPASESALGLVLPDLRDQIWICSRSPPLSSGPEFEKNSELVGCDELLVGQGLGESLSRLGVKKIDCYALEAVDDPDRLREAGLIDLLGKAKEDGRIGHIGLSTHRNVEKVVEATLDLGFFDVLMVPINILNFESMRPLLKKVKSADIGVIATHTTVGVAAPREGRSLDLMELPPELTPHQLAYLHALNTYACAGLIMNLDSVKRAEHNLQLGTLDLGVNGANELDAIIDQELWPLCSACGEQRSFNAAALEAHYHALWEWRRRLAVIRSEGGPATQAVPRPGFQAICKQCAETIGPS